MVVNMNIELTLKKSFVAKFLKVSADVRYWDDAVINGESNESGDGVPFKNGGLWEPIIDIDNGRILDWPKDVSAEFHFKVCDSGSYYLLDEHMGEIASIENNYVPSGLCHGSDGYGDYIIMKVNGDGEIVGYRNNIYPDDWNSQDI